MAKRRLRVIASCATLFLLTQTRSMGGSAETDVIELTVKP
jgi:hypothetical protein